MRTRDSYEKPSVFQAKATGGWLKIEAAKNFLAASQRARLLMA